MTRNEAKKLIDIPTLYHNKEFHEFFTATLTGFINRGPYIESENGGLFDYRELVAVRPATKEEIAGGLDA